MIYAKKINAYNDDKLIILFSNPSNDFSMKEKYWPYL